MARRKGLKGGDTTHGQVPAPGATSKGPKMRATFILGFALPSVAAAGGAITIAATAAAATTAAGAAAALQQQQGPKLAWWVDGPTNGGCAGWGLPYPGYNASFKSQPSCWGKTLDLITKHASLIDEIELSTDFVVTNTSHGLLDLDRDGSAWCGPTCGFRVRPLDMIPHYIPDLLKVLKPGTKIKVAIDFENNATQTSHEAFANADALAKQLLTLATTYPWISGYIFDYEADCGDCPPGPHQGVQNITECLLTRRTCIPKEAALLATFFKTVSSALHTKDKTLGFATNKNGAGYEHWPYYQSYLDAGVDRLYEMGTYGNHSCGERIPSCDQPGDRENVTLQLLQYPLNRTAFGLGDYLVWDTPTETAAWLQELVARSASMPGQLMVHVYDLYGGRVPVATPDNCAANNSGNGAGVGAHCARPPDSWWPVFEKFHYLQTIEKTKNASVQSYGSHSASPSG